MRNLSSWIEDEFRNRGEPINGNVSTIAGNIHLVHVFRRGDGNSFIQILLRDYALQESHTHEIVNECKKCRAEQLLGLGHNVYYYVGRALPDVGWATLAFEAGSEENR